MIHYSFNQIEAKLNHVALSTEIFKSQHDFTIRTAIFEHLRKIFSNLYSIDYNCEKFLMKFHYSHNYLDFEPYDLGEVELVFSINTKKVFEKNEFNGKECIYFLADSKPVSFVGYQIRSFIPSFEISFDENGKATLSRNSIHDENPFVFEVIGKTVSDLIKNIKSTYAKCLYKSIFEKETDYISQPKNKLTISTQKN